jgi:hypothetical protein
VERFPEKEKKLMRQMFALLDDYCLAHAKNGVEQRTLMVSLVTILASGTISIMDISLQNKLDLAELFSCQLTDQIKCAGKAKQQWGTA